MIDICPNCGSQDVHWLPFSESDLHWTCAGCKQDFAEAKKVRKKPDGQLTIFEKD